MDGVVADFDKGIKQHCPDLHTASYDKSSFDKVNEICEQNPLIFLHLEPIPMAINAVKALWPFFDVYFLSTPMWHVHESYSSKRVWLEIHFGEMAKERLILTHRKDLAIGDYLVDDSVRHGQDKFTGKHIHYGAAPYDNWMIVMLYLMNNK